VTEPQPVMAQAEQDQLTRQVGRALLAVAGADWQQVRAEYRSAGRHVEVDVFVKGPDGVERPARPPQEVVDGLGRLRQGMYRPGRGTWLSALYVLDPPSAFSAEFEPDVEPRWRRVPPPIGFADELRFFPRADEHIPDWLRQRAGLPPIDGPATPEGGSAPAPGGPGGQGGPGERLPGGPSGLDGPGTTGGPGAPGGPGTAGTPSGPGTPGGLPLRPPAPGAPGAGGRPPAGPPIPQPGMPYSQGAATPPRGMQQPHGAPTPSPGIPATPFGGEPSPPRGFDANPTPPRGVPTGPTAQPGIPAHTPPHPNDDRNWTPPAR
jgi:hypothetical protein